jgi:peptidyl-prolyl cis-trans isomerase C
MTLKPAHLLMLVLATAAMPVMAQNLAVVNGKPIPSSRADLMMKQYTSRGQKDSPDMREKIKDQLIDFEILTQEAEKLGLTKTDEVKNQLALTRQQILINALVQDHIKKFPVKDADIKAEYDKFKAETPATEYHAFHILVEKEEDAKAIIAKLKEGAKFEDLAKQSKDPGSAAKGGDLDWSNPNGYVKPFSDALVALKKGQFTETPVKTQYGYHVIKLEDTRPAKIPTLEEMKPNISQKLQQKELEAYRDSLRKQAKIDKVAEAKDTDKAKAPAAKADAPAAKADAGSTK